MKNTNTITNENAIKLTAVELVEKLNATASTLSVDELPVMLAKINTAINAENETAINTRVDTLISLANADKIGFFREFINTPYATCERVKLNAKTGEYELVDCKRSVDFGKIETAFEKAHEKETLAQAKNYKRMLSLFGYNMLQSFAKEIVSDSKTISVPALTKKDDDETFVDFGKNSMNAMETQLNAIVNTILPQELAVKMLKCDVKAIMEFVKSSNILDGSFTFKNEKIILRAIFTAIRVRSNGQEYAINSKLKATKAPKEKAVKDEKAA